MIFIDRSSVAKPRSLKSARAEKAYQEARRFFKTPRQSRQHKSHRFNNSVCTARDVQAALVKLFHGKCAFCESPTAAVGAIDMEHFRPKTGAIGLDQRSDPAHYWWLTYEWTNLYPACRVCNRNKGARFPTARRRVAPEIFFSELREEGPLLLDPCEDQPEKHFVFDEKGYVASIPPEPAILEREEHQLFGGHDRGQTTIDVFGLNRSGLVQARRATASETKKEVSALLGKHAFGGFDQLHRGAEELFSEARPFAALRRQIAMRTIEDLPETSPGASELKRFIGQDRLRATVQMISADTETEAFQSLTEHVAVASKHSIELEVEKSTFIRRSDYLDRVEIENFRSINALDFGFPTLADDRIGWKVLLGENGVGKSSVLHAVALALMGNRHSRALRLEPEKLLRRGARTGYIRVQLSADTDPVEVKITKNSLEFPKTSRLRTITLGFGAARWLPRPGAAKPDRNRHLRVRNLFNPFVPLGDARAWLSDLPEREFRRAERTIKSLLRLHDEDRLRRRRGEVVVHFHDEPPSRSLGLDQLSDGNETVLAMAADIMELMFDEYDDIANAEGVVLIDEIDAHLHPRWKMRIVGSLREAFPKIQFLATTHEPLCLRGLYDNEILVMHQRGEGLEVLDDLPSPDNLRVDQLLTSHLFGLHSTLDPKTEEQFDRYYALLARDEGSLTRTERRELDRLKKSVGGKGILGDTRRDRMIYEIIDKHLASDPFNKDAAGREETMNLVAELWDQVSDPESYTR